jgi:prepilin-type N-terminal cleavage/methylation domain-containing protein
VTDTFNFKSLIVNPTLSLNNPSIPLLVKGDKGGFERGGLGRISGFTLLEVLVAVAILGIAVTVVLQLFSADLRAISASEDYVAASTKANVKIRELLADDNLSEMSSSEITEEGDRMDISITDALKDRTENLQVRLLEIDVTIHWTRGTKEKSLTLRTLKVVEKEI